MAVAASSSEQADAFAGSFGRLRRQVRLRRTARSALTGVALGSAAGALLTLALWAARFDDVRPYAALLAALGGAVGAALALRRRWSDEEIALFADARLAAREAVTTALRAGGAAPVERAVRAQAAAVLAGADPRRLRPRLLARVHALCVPAGAAIVWLSVIDVPAASAGAPKAPGAAMIRRTEVKGLERIEALEDAPGLSAADVERLRQLAREARSLRKDLALGVEKREAQARLAKLRDAVSAERQRFGDRASRPGLEASAAALSSHAATRKAAESLGEGDVVAFDEEMQRLANRAEAEARDDARRALEEAAGAAREKGNKKLAELLERQRKLFDERSESARALRELAKALEGQLGEEAREALRDFKSTGDPEAARRLAEALGSALAGLSEAERRELAEKLAKELGAQSGTERGMTPEELAALAKQLASPEGQQALRDALKEFAGKPGADADRERALDEAERGGAEAERGLLPMPLGGAPTPGAGTPAQSGAGAKEPGPGNGTGGSKPPKSSLGSPLQAEELRSKAETRVLPGTPLETRSLGRAPARPGEVANERGTGELGHVGPAEIGAVEKSDIPEEYRQHVGRYFEPR